MVDGLGALAAAAAALGLILGLKGARPRGVSAVTLKWPVNGGPTEEGHVEGSHCIKYMINTPDSLCFNQQTS